MINIVNIIISMFLISTPLKTLNKERILPTPPLPSVKRHSVVVDISCIQRVERERERERESLKADNLELFEDIL